MEHKNKRMFTKWRVLDKRTTRPHNYTQNHSFAQQQQQKRLREQQEFAANNRKDYNRK